jgi:CPA2 family monovalent cation:H+ antiporter-2
MDLVGRLAVSFAVLFGVRWLSGRLGQSAVPGYVLAGVLLGPETPGPAALHPGDEVDLLAELGLMLLLFFVGLEFPLRRLHEARGPIAVGGAVDLVANGLIGAVIGLAMFGVSAAALLCAGAVYVTSSAVVVQALTDFRRTANDETDLVLGILVFEDIAIAVFVAVAGGAVVHESTSAAGVLGTVAVAAGFLVAAGAVAALAPGLLSRRLDRLAPEALILFAFAWLLGASALSEGAGLSEAFGAFLAGVALAGTAVRREIEDRFLAPRELFAAVFFFAFGLTIQVRDVSDFPGMLALAVMLAVAGKVLAGVVASRSVGLPLRRGVIAGLTLVPRGEFSIVIAQLGAGAALVATADADRLQSFVGLYVLATAVGGTLLTRWAPAIGGVAERTFVRPRVADATPAGRLSVDDLRE